MNINIQVPKYEQFRAFYVFFIISTMQLGVGMIGTPRLVFQKAGHDGWISIILVYFFLLLVLFTMLYILKQYENADILGIQSDLFGNFLAKVLGTIYIIYFGSEILSILVTYIEIVKVFIFPDSSSFILGLMIITLIVYSCIGGLRIIIGVTFIFFLLTHWVILLLPVPMAQIDWFNFLPVMDRGIIDIIKGTASTSYTFMGFEIFFFLYPFIQNKKKVKQPMVWGVSYSVFLMLLITVTTIGFLSPEQLQRRIWPALHLFKIQTSPLLERLDYIVVAEWMMVTLPNMMLLMWGITYTAKRLYKIPTKATLYITAGLLLASVSLFNSHFEIQRLTDTVKSGGIFITYIYPFILLPLVLIKKKWRKKKKEPINDANE